MVNEAAIPLPSQVVGHLPQSKNVNTLIREEIRKILTTDDTFAREILSYIHEPGKAGNRQMDQGVAAQLFFTYTYEETGKKPVYTSYDFLSHKLMWTHIAHVMAELRYEMAGGYVVRHLLTNDKLEEKEAA